MKVCFETFGCRLNKAEALQQEAEYLAAGWETTEKHSNADLIVVRCCSVTSKAQAECERLIRHLREKYPFTRLSVCGCTKERTDSDGGRFASPSGALPTRTARAYLKVQDGCGGRCSFCIVPQFRGASASVDFDTAVTNARRFAEAGYHEIVVTGCNLSLYASRGKRLPELIDALASVDANCRVRIGSLEPGACAKETIGAMAAHANVCRFLHMPIQSGSDKVLTAMGRPYSVEDAEDAIAEATGLMPGLGLGCDMMTGFPGENEIDFAQSRKLLARHPFSNAHVFPYSRRPGTTASEMMLQVPREVRSERAHELAAIVKTKRSAFARSFIGKTVEAVIENDRTCIGWTGEYLQCKSVGMNLRKALVRMLVTRTHGDVLEGRRI